MKEKRSSRFWCALTLFSLVGQIAWVVENMYLNVFIYKMFRASAADISAMVAASAVAATLTTVFMGALSDRVGKRKAFIAIGYILWGLSIAAFALIRVDYLSALFPTVSAAALRPSAKYSRQTASKATADSSKLLKITGGAKTSSGPL